MVDTVKRTIRDSGQTMYAIAQGAGIPYPIVNRLVNGRRSISVANLDKLCDYLGLELVRTRAPRTKK